MTPESAPLASRRPPGTLATRRASWKLWNGDRHCGNYLCWSCQTVRYCAGPRTDRMWCSACYLPELEEDRLKARAIALANRKPTTIRRGG